MCMLRSSTVCQCYGITFKLLSFTLRPHIRYTKIEIKKFEQRLYTYKILIKFQKIFSKKAEKNFTVERNVRIFYTMRKKFHII